MKLMFILIVSLAGLYTCAISALTGHEAFAVSKQPPQTETPKDFSVVSGLSWESNPARDAWSKVLKSEIELKWSSLKNAKDLNQVCTNFLRLDEEKQKEVWAELFAQMAFFESTWNPGAYYFEKGLGYSSEGLFQLSYVDESWAKCGMNKKTENLKNPEINIKCAVKIMARQIDLKKAAILSKGAYWSVIMPGHKNCKLPQIKARLEKKLAHCI